jgi:hypothetical protein
LKAFEDFQDVIGKVQQKHNAFEWKPEKQMLL